MAEVNFFVFVDRLSNFRVTLRHLVYGANISRPEHRALCNVKRGDLIFIYVMDTRSLYGPFIAEGRVFEDKADIGWRIDGRIADWPHRVPFKPWMNRVGVLDRYRLQRVYRRIRSRLVTIRDLDDLHRRYLNTLLRGEGLILLETFLEEAVFMEPREVSEDFAAKPLRGEPLDARELLRRGRAAEYVVELYLLQNPGKLAELAGSGFSEVYNQVYVYQNRFLDLLVVHRLEGKVIKATVIEVKATCNEGSVAKGVEELGHYMSTMADWMGGSPKTVYGVLLTPTTSSSSLKKVWREKCREIAGLYEIPRERLLWTQYEISASGELSLK